MAERLLFCHAQRQSAFHLGAGNGFEACAVVLRFIGGIVQPQRQYARDERGKLHAHVGQAVENKEQLNHDGGAADELGAAQGKGAQGARSEKPHHGDAQPRGEGDEHGADGHLKGDDGSSAEGGQKADVALQALGPASRAALNVRPVLILSLIHI